MHVDMQRVTPVGWECVSVGELHFFLTAVRGKKYTLAVAQDAEMNVVSGRRRHSDQGHGYGAACGKERGDSSGRHGGLLRGNGEPDSMKLA